MEDRLRRGILIGVVAGLFLGFLGGAVSNKVLREFEPGQESDQNDSNDISTYNLIKFQLRERIKGYEGLTGAVERDSAISENEHPENISKKVKDWLGGDASCRHYAALTFTIMAEHGYDNISLKMGYINIENERTRHLWLTWENKSLEYPLVQRLLKHEAENVYSKDELWN